MSGTCRDCGWRLGANEGRNKCTFALPAWLLAYLRHAGVPFMARSIGVVNFEDPFLDCPTWKPREETPDA